MTASPDARPYTPLAGFDSEAALELTPVQHAQLDAALTYHSLLAPGALISARIAIGDSSQLPALTDQTTVSGEAISELPVAGEVQVRSIAVGLQSAQRVTRSFRLSSAEASPATTRPAHRPSLPRRVYRCLEQLDPMSLDTVREFLMRRRERAIGSGFPRFPDGPADEQATQAFAAWNRSPAAPPPESKPAVLFGLHWLQTGGAERWAVESIQIAKEAGFLPIVVTDQNSVHPWLSRPELEGCLTVTLSFVEHEHPIDVAFAHALLENYNVRGVVLHHSHYLYRVLPWIKEQRPDLPVVDSLHIVEYLGGGYPGLAARFDEFIDTHHVISPQLVDWLSQTQGVAPEKIALAPLASLTTVDTGGFATRKSGHPLTVAFIGRLSRQKRPDVFLGLIARLKKQGVDFRAILHGDGELHELVDSLLPRFGLTEVIEQRFEDTPVSATLAETDVLVITSINEGITLTTFEANAAGIPVISTDVGSQRTIVQGSALLPRPARRFIRGAATLIAQLEQSEQLREQVWAGQRVRIAEFSELPTAHHFMKELFASWQA